MYVQSKFWLSWICFSEVIGVSVILCFDVYDWVQSSVHSPVPTNAVRCSTDLDGSEVYIGRVRHNDALMLVKVVPRHKAAYFAYYWKEHFTNNYEILVNHLHEQPRWETASHGRVPLNAVQCGYNKDGHKLYVGRARHQHLLVPGYVHPHLQCIYYPYGGKENTSKHYEVLVHNVTSN